MCLLQVVGTDPRGHVPLNTPVPVETDTFVGRMCNLIRGCPGTPDAEFRGTKLQAKSIIQVGLALCQQLRGLRHLVTWPAAVPRSGPSKQRANTAGDRNVRLHFYVLQGMFKTPMAANDIWVGQELLKPPLLPAR